MKHSVTFVGLVAGVVFALQSAAFAQPAIVTGSLGNFDVANNQEQEAHGFEVEFEGIQVSDVLSTFETERYGAPSINATGTGVVVRWASAFDRSSGFVATTLPHAAGAPLVGACYQWAGSAYDASGCEHFGVTLKPAAFASSVTYRWLVADPSLAGALAAGPVPISVATPAYWIAAATTPVLNADVVAPARADFPTRYGDALWMKVYKTQLGREVALGELTNDNPAVVPEQSSALEVAWLLMQADPLIQFTNGGGNPGASRARTRNSGPLDGGTKSVVRRYELYEYTGLYDPFFHQAVCANSNCSSPAAGELGDIVSAQMTAANVTVPSVTVAKVGTGTVKSSDGRINCGTSCATLYPTGATTTLIASASGGTKFAGWSGACTGTAQSCTVAVGSHLDISATFTAQSSTPPLTTTTPTTAAPATSSATLATVSIGISNKGGVVTADGAIDCPNRQCSAKLPVGSTVTLTAAPTVGAFQGWSGACTGTNPSCTFTLAADSKIQATFAK